jgi:hypothetical protein
MAYTVAQMINDGRAEARKLHNLAEQVETSGLVEVGPPGSGSVRDQAIHDYIKALRQAHSMLVQQLDLCEPNSG